LRRFAGALSGCFVLLFQPEVRKEDTARSDDAEARVNDYFRFMAQPSSAANISSCVDVSSFLAFSRLDCREDANHGGGVLIIARNQASLTTY
jgi:hypothetical protein